MGTDRFAFCIIAHNEPIVFKTLVAQIDHPDNDIFVMIDKKADITQFNDVRTLHSRIYFCTDRIDIRWGELSQVKAELEVFSLAMNHGKYLYYHLLSGQDLLIKPVEHLNAFMRENKGKEFIGFQKYISTLERVHRRMNYYHIKPSFCRSNNLIKRYGYKFLIILQKLLCFKRNTDVKSLGSNWASLSDKFVKILVSHKAELYDKFRFTLCPDELYKQYIFDLFIPSKKLGLGNNDGTDNLRFIDWTKGKPYIWQEDDYDELVRSSAFISRKFSSKNKNLINRIFNYTKGK